MLPMSEHDLKMLESLESVKADLEMQAYNVGQLILKIKAKYQMEKYQTKSFTEAQLAYRNGQN